MQRETRSITAKGEVDVAVHSEVEHAPLCLNRDQSSRFERAEQDGLFATVVHGGRANDVRKLARVVRWRASICMGTRTRRAG